jgi:hypothetical protein
MSVPKSASEPKLVSVPLNESVLKSQEHGVRHTGDGSAKLAEYKLMCDSSPERLERRVQELANDGYLLMFAYATYSLGARPASPPKVDRRHGRAPELHDIHFAWMAKGAKANEGANVRERASSSESTISDERL